MTTALSILVFGFLILCICGMDKLGALVFHHHVARQPRRKKSSHGYHRTHAPARKLHT